MHDRGAVRAGQRFPRALAVAALGFAVAIVRFGMLFVLHEPGCLRPFWATLFAFDPTYFRDILAFLMYDLRIAINSSSSFEKVLQVQRDFIYKFAI